MNKLLSQIREDEGFDGNPYIDTLGIPTIGVGTKLPLSEDEAMAIAKMRLQEKIDHLLSVKPIVMVVSQERQEVLFNMSFQLGVNGLLKFKKMWKAIEDHDYQEASRQMLDSRWNIQTPRRAEKLAKIMKGQHLSPTSTHYNHFKQ